MSLLLLSVKPIRSLDLVEMNFPETAEESALKVAEKVREQLKKDVESRWPITFSMGLVTYL